jgi:hypothetical protein
MLMLKNAEKHRDNPEFQQTCLMTVDHAVERMRQLMLQLRRGQAARRYLWRQSGRRHSVSEG